MPFLVRNQISATKSASYYKSCYREDCCSLAVGEKWSENQHRVEGSYSKQEIERKESEVRLPLWCRVHSDCRGRAGGTDCRGRAGGADYRGRAGDSDYRGRAGGTNY